MKRTDTLFATARVINGPDFAERPWVRRERSAPLVAEPGTRLPEKCLRWSCSASVAHPIDQMLRRWEWLDAFLDDDWICLTNNAAELSLRVAARGRNARRFAGCERMPDPTAAMATLINTAGVSGVDPAVQLISACEHAHVGCELANVLARIRDFPKARPPGLPLWN